MVPCLARIDPCERQWNVYNLFCVQEKKREHVFAKKILTFVLFRLNYKKTPVLSKFIFDNEINYKL